MSLLRSYLKLLNTIDYKKNYYINTSKLWIYFSSKKIINKIYFNSDLIKINLNSFSAVYLFMSIVNFYLLYSTFLELSSLKFGHFSAPKKYKTFTVLKSPHSDKKSREQFHLIAYKQKIKYPIFLSIGNSFLFYYYSIYPGIKFSNVHIKYVM
jgi:ribosomal protein S10